jgi:hypothetical protein
MVDREKCRRLLLRAQGQVYQGSSEPVKKFPISSKSIDIL